MAAQSSAHPSDTEEGLGCCLWVSELTPPTVRAPGAQAGSQEIKACSRGAAAADGG